MHCLKLKVSHINDLLISLSIFFVIYLIFIQFRNRLMREIVSLNIGQAGTAIGSSFWEMLCLEHGINHDGSVGDKGLNDPIAASIFFAESHANRQVPRAVFVDPDPITIDQLKMGKQKGLFNPSSLIKGKEDTSSIYARGKYTIGKEMASIENPKSVLERIRRLVEASPGLQGFIVTHAISGGASSGLGSLLLEQIKSEYPKKTIVGLNVFPSPEFNVSVVEPYNSILSMGALLKYYDASLVFDNSGLYNFCSRRLELEKPNYTNINRIIAQQMSNLTSSIRFDGSLYNDLTEFPINLCPTTDAHFLLSSFSPAYNNNQKVPMEKLQIGELTNQAFNEDNLFAKINTEKMKFMACSLLYRGDAPQKDICAALAEIKANNFVLFEEWATNQIKIGLNQSNPFYFSDGDLGKSNRQVSMLGNSSRITRLFKQIKKNHNKLYSKRAFVHWYVGEGMEEGEFSEASESLDLILKAYNDLSPEQENELQDDQTQNAKQKYIAAPAQQAKYDNKNDNKPQLQSKLAQLQQQIARAQPQAAVQPARARAQPQQQQQQNSDLVANEPQQDDQDANDNGRNGNNGLKVNAIQ